MNLRRALNFFNCACALAREVVSPLPSSFCTPALLVEMAPDTSDADAACVVVAAAAGAGNASDEDVMTGRAAGAPQCATIHLCCSTA